MTKFIYREWAEDKIRVERPFLDSAFSYPFLPLPDWQMSLAERFTFLSILDQIRPSLAIEIGTYRGGSLQAISHYSSKVLSVDINESFRENLAGMFPNVEFHVGDSKEVLPGLVDGLNSENRSPEFVLIDGAHSRDGVRSDIESILGIRPFRDMVILCHDSFNPDCRAGMLDANWSKSPFVQFVELDLVAGNLVEQDFDTSLRGEMWGGLAIAILSPSRRDADLIVSQSRKWLFETALGVSCYGKNSRQSNTQEKVISRFKKQLRTHAFSRWPIRFLSKLKNKY